MNKYQLVNLLKQNEDAYQKLQEDCRNSINGNASVDDVLMSLDSIFANCFDLNVKRETCDKIRYLVAK